MKKFTYEQFEKNERRGRIIEAVILILALLMTTIIGIKEYIEFKDKVCEVEAVVIDSLNYKSTLTKLSHYNSKIKLQWVKDNVIYQGDLLVSGTVLVGEKRNITVLIDEPSQIRFASLSGVIGMIIFTSLIIFVLVFIFNINKFYKRFIVKSQKKNDLYVDVGEKLELDRKNKARKKLFFTSLLILFIIGSSFTVYDDCKTLIIEKSRRDIRVECLVLKLDKFEDETTIIGKWEIDGQVYKKELTVDNGEYEVGKRYSVLVKEDTIESRKIEGIANVSTVILLLICDIVAIIILIFILLDKKRPGFIDDIIYKFVVYLYSKRKV